MSSDFMVRVLAALLAVTTLTFGYPNYQDRIPNGRQVPHPCKPNYVWHGVGHTNPLGGGPKNTFGAAFLRLGSEWNRELCEEDSDGDGHTNGEELGDPDCVWTPGDLPSRTSSITHPGVCDPWEDSLCQTFNTWIDCNVGDLECDLIDNDPDVKNITIRFPPTPVPNTETNYMCMSFDLPADEVYHIIGSRPFIDNAQVMHHIILYSCEDAEEPPTISTPRPCGMEAGTGCQSVIGGWTVGSAGQCLPEAAGYLFGKGHYTRVVMEMHWNNPELSADYTDSSGLTLYYTPNLRPNNATTFVLGQRVLEIPPRQRSVVISGTCPSSCSSALISGNLYVSSALNHMHYLGTSEKVEVIRDGRLVTRITDEVYSYDTPQFITHDPPIEIRPGDELKTTCVYNSQYRNETVRYGDGTNDEMCFAFLFVYPKESLPYIRYCFGVGEESICDYLRRREQGDREGGDGSSDGGREPPSSGEGEDVIEGCHWKEFINNNSAIFQDTFKMLSDNCDAFGSCRPECGRVMERLARHPCARGRAWEKVKDEMLASYHGMLMLAYANSCPVAFCPRCQLCS